MHVLIYFCFYDFSYTTQFTRNDMAAEISGHSILDEEALNKLTKSDLVKYALNVSNLTDLINSLSNKIDALNDRLIKSESEIAIASKSNAVLRNHVDLLESRLNRLERFQAQDSQYLRNRQVELKKFPEVDDASLKEKVCDLLTLTGVAVVPANIDKCHRLSNRANVIVEFKEREVRDKMLRSRKHLKTKSKELGDMQCAQTMIHESMTPVYSLLDFLCRRLKRDGHLSQSWFFNGKLWIIVNEGDEKANIVHIQDLYNFFGIESVDIYIRGHWFNELLSNAPSKWSRDHYIICLIGFSLLAPSYKHVCSSHIL